MNETNTIEDATTAPPSHKKPSFYFGSYCEVTKGGAQASDITDEDTAVVNDWTERFDELVQRQNELEASLPNKIATAVSENVTNQLAPLSNEFKSHKQQTNEKIEQILKGLKNLQSSQTSQINQILNSLTQDTPSGAPEESSRGGDK